MTAPNDHIKVDAETFARAWLSVALASGKDPDQTLLDRTVCLERHVTGIRLVATDRYVILHAWVPAVGWDASSTAPPGTEPDEIAVPVDPHGRGKGLMAHILNLHAPEDAKPAELTITLDQAEPEDDPQGVLDGLDLHWAVLTYPNRERLRLQNVQGVYPSWDSIFDGYTARKTADLALNPEIIGRLAKLGKLHRNVPLRWHFGGEDRLALLEIGEDPPIRGAVMPVRWGFDADETQPADA